MPIVCCRCTENHWIDFFYARFGHSVEFNFETFLMLAQRIVSHWKFIGLFSFSWLWMLSAFVHTVHFAFSTSLVSGFCQTASLAATVTARKKKIVRTYTYFRRAVVPIHYSFRIVILFEINNIAFSVWLRLIPLSISHTFPPIWRLFTHQVKFGEKIDREKKIWKKPAHTEWIKM